MMYNLLVSDEDLPARLGDFLAAVFEVDRGRVFVGNRAEQTAWDWGALSDSLVNCQYFGVPGDLAWALDIFAREEVPKQPTETELSLRIARELRTVTLFSEGMGPSSVWRLFTADGEHLHARLADLEDDDESEGRIAEVEAFVPELPGAVVARFPDVIKGLRLPTPLADSCFPEKSEHRLLRRTRSDLRAWESLTARMAGGWPPSAWYPASMYRDDLDARDDLGREVAELSAVQRAMVGETLRRIDARYRELTVDDGGAALVRAGEADSEGMGRRPWYWCRRPDPLPWDDAPPESDG